MTTHTHIRLVGSYSKVLFVRGYIVQLYNRQIYSATCFRTNLKESSAVSRVRDNSLLVGVLTGLGNERSVSTVRWLYSGHWVIRYLVLN